LTKQSPDFHIKKDFLEILVENFEWFR